MSDNLIEKAMDLAASGKGQEAIESLWPLIRDEQARPQALFTLAFCYERADNFSTAAYIYGKAIEADPENELASERQAYCKREAEERGLFEDFTDLGHVACPCDALRQRAEYPNCPYCGRSREGADPLAPNFIDEADEPLPGWDDPSFGERLEGASGAARERVKEWMERDEVRQVTDRIGKVSENVSETAKQIAEDERVKSAASKIQQAGEIASERVTSFLESEAVRDAAGKVRAVSDEAAARAKVLTESEKVQELTQKAKELGAQTGEKLEKISEDPRFHSAAEQVKKTGLSLKRGLKSIFGGGFEEVPDDEDAVETEVEVADEDE